MKKGFFLLLALMANLSVCFAQTELKLADDEAEGYIIDSKGTKHEGIIILASSGHNPWENQDRVYVVDKAVYQAANGKFSKKDRKKFEAKEVKEYVAGKRKFMAVKYNNIQGAAKTGTGGTSRLTAIAGAAKNLASSEFMAEVITEGKITLYRFYNSPPPVGVSLGESQAAESARIEKECREIYDILYVKEGSKDKAKAVARPGEVSAGKEPFKDVIEDCKDVLKKYEDGTYTMKPLKKGLKGMINEAMSGKSLEEKVVEIIADYNKICK